MADEPTPPSERKLSPRAEFSAAPENIGSECPRYTLPTDLDAAIKYLDDQQLDRLATAVLEERARRRGSVRGKTPAEAQVKTDAASLPVGKVNAVRAAFRAGVKPTRIAREFGVSRADVQRALAGMRK
jgi:hypothetical protein